MRYETEEELKAAYDAEVAEMALVKNNSEILQQLLIDRWGKVPSEINAYLNGEPESSVLKDVLKAIVVSSNPDEFLAAFEKAVSASQAVRA